MSGLYTFKWSAPAETVYVTGSFDKWAKSELMDKDPTTGQFFKTVNLPKGKVEYKYLVDGEWELDTTAKTEDNGTGIKNNYLLAGDIEEPSMGTGMAGTNKGFTRETSMPGGFPLDTPNESATVEDTGILPRNEVPDSTSFDNGVKASQAEYISEPFIAPSDTGLASTVPSTTGGMDTGSVPSEYYTSREMDAKDSLEGVKAGASSQDYSSREFDSSERVMAGDPSQEHSSVDAIESPGIDTANMSSENYTSTEADAFNSSGDRKGMLAEESMIAGDLGTATILTSSSSAGDTFAAGNSNSNILSNEEANIPYAGQKMPEFESATGNRSDQLDDYSSVGRGYSSADKFDPQAASTASEMPGAPTSTPAVTMSDMSTAPSSAVIDEKIRNTLPSSSVQESPTGESDNDTSAAPLMDTNLVDSRENERAYSSEGPRQSTSNSANKPAEFEEASQSGPVSSTPNAGSFSGTATHSSVTAAESSLPSASLARETGEMESTGKGDTIPRASQPGSTMPSAPAKPDQVSADTVKHSTSSAAGPGSTGVTPVKASQSSTTSTPSKSSASGTPKPEKKKGFLGKIKKAFQ